MKRDTLSPDESSHVTDRGCAIARRQFFGDCGVGIGKIALGSLPVSYTHLTLPTIYSV